MPQFYRYVIYKLQPREDSIILKDENGQVTYVSEDVCNTLSLEFSNNFADESHTMISPHPTKQCNFHVDLSMSSLLNVIQGLPSSAAGPDGIPAIVYKCCSNNLARPLLHIFQQSVFQGRLPKA